MQQSHPVDDSPFSATIRFANCCAILFSHFSFLFILNPSSSRKTLWPRPSPYLFFDVEIPQLIILSLWTQVVLKLRKPHYLITTSLITPPIKCSCNASLQMLPYGTCSFLILTHTCVLQEFFVNSRLYAHICDFFKLCEGAVGRSYAFGYLNRASRSE